MRKILELLRRALGVCGLVSEVDRLRSEIAEVRRLVDREFTACVDLRHDIWDPLGERPAI